MTLIIIFSVFILIGVALATWAEKRNLEPFWIGLLGWVLVFLFGIGEAIAIPEFIMSKKSSEIVYQQLLEERTAIVQMLENDRDVDRIALNKLVIDYNNRVIESREDSKRSIFKEYYSDAVDWDALETIEWR